MKQKGLEKPNIFPVAALPALEIRSKPQDELEKLHRNYCIDIMNNYVNLHLEKYSVLEVKDDKLKNMSDEEKTIVHTGILVLENKIIKRGRENERNFYKI